MLAGAGVFLRPTSWDGDSVIVREALALGARVVASDLAPRPLAWSSLRSTRRRVAHAVLHGGRAATVRASSTRPWREAATRALAVARSVTAASTGSL